MFVGVAFFAIFSHRMTHVKPSIEFRCLFCRAVRHCTFCLGTRFSTRPEPNCLENRNRFQTAYGNTTGTAQSGPPLLPSCTCRKTITPHPSPSPGLEDLVWTVVSSSENKGARMRRKRPEKMLRRYSGRAFISASDTAKAA